ncbi:hypothetical protein ACHZ98_04525 [Streptomyces sp. MAR4 CNY-716]
MPASSTVDLRTGHVGPAYGLGDHGSFGDGRPETGTPCSGKVEARPRAELTGLVLDNVTNQGSCKRFVSTFAVFPRQSFAEVLFAEGQKRVGLTEAENRLGVAGADGVDGLHYFLGTDVKQLYADYRRARHAAGYADVRPRPQMFELGWEAYGALGQGPWQFGDDVAADARKLALWHDSLHPYIYDAVLDGHASGFPYAMMPLHLAYPADERTYGLVDESTRRYEWMLGESLLAAPVWGSDFATATGRDVYLPAGTWIDVNTGERHEGPVTLTDHEVARGDVPAFVGGKGVLVRRVEAGSSDRLRAQVFPVTRGSVYSYGDGKSTSRIVNANAGWSAKSLKVLDTTASRAVDFSVDPVTGAVGFPLRAGHDYRLVGGRA